MASKFCGNRTCLKSNAKFVCARCGSEFYCSKHCQARAFAEHRFNCFELPSLRPVDENDDLSPQLAALEVTDARSETTNMKQVEVVETKAPVVVIAPKPKPVIVETPAPAVVKKQDFVPLQVLKKQSEVVTPHSKEFLESIPPIQEPKVLKSKGSMVSMFRSKETPPPVKEQESSRIVLSDLKLRPFPSGKFKVTLLQGDPETKIFSACQRENLDYLTEIGTKIAEHTKDTTTTPYKPKKEEMVLALFEGTYYRAVCKEKSNEGYLVDYIDYGNSATVKEQDIRVFDRSLMLEIVVYTVLLENFPDSIDEKTAAILEEDGIPLEAARKLKDGYVARIIGL